MFKWPKFNHLMQRESDQRPNEVGLRFKKWNRTSPCLSPEETQHWREASSQSKVGLYCISFFICFDLLPKVNFVSIMFLLSVQVSSMFLTLSLYVVQARLSCKWGHVLKTKFWSLFKEKKQNLGPFSLKKYNFKTFQTLIWAKSFINCNESCANVLPAHAQSWCSVSENHIRNISIF